MSIQVSLPIADIYDKLTILDIKKENIKDERVSEIIKEISILRNDTSNLVVNEKYYNMLKEINNNLFNLLDKMYEINHDVSNPSYADLCKKSFIENDRRFRMKRKINNLHNSIIKEVKSYKSTVCIFLNDPEKELNKEIIENINMQSTYYDKVYYLINEKNTLFYNDGSIYGITKDEFNSMNKDNIIFI
jgi:uncharacterized membrane protein YheB (UPF0754 family)